jgi:hypothetical protein
VRERERERRWTSGEKQADDLRVVKLGRAGKLGRNEAGGLLMLSGSGKKRGHVGLDRLQKKERDREKTRFWSLIFYDFKTTNINKKPCKRNECET